MPASKTMTPPKYLNLPAAAAHVGLSVRSLRRLIVAGRLRTFRPVNRVLLDRAELERVVRRAEER